MKNADKPINPLKGADDIFFNEREEAYIKEVKPLIGLTKREYFAGLAMQGILANPNGVMNEHGNWMRSPESIARMSIKFADELLKQLEEK